MTSTACTRPRASACRPSRSSKRWWRRASAADTRCSVSRSAASWTSKKAAKAAHDKKIELIHVKDLLATTGYIRGGCSPIGMKKQFPTFIDETAQLYDEIGVSAGCRGCQVLLDPMQLMDYVNATLCDLTE